MYEKCLWVTDTIHSVLHGAVSSCIPKTETMVNIVGAYFVPEIWQGKTEGNSGHFRLCTPHELDLLGESLPTVTLTTQPRTLHKPLHKTGHTLGFNVMPSNIRWGQWPSPHPAAVTSEKERPFQERVGTSYDGTGNPTERQREALQQLLCLKCKMWICLEEVPASITVCKHSLWRRASPVSHSSLP